MVLFLSYVTAVCFLSRFPTLFRQISLTLTLFFPNSFAFQSLFLFLMSLLSYCLSFVHCISSILSDFVCFICRSLSFLPQFLNFFAFVSRSFSYLRHCGIFVFRCLSFSFLCHCCLIAFRSSTVFRQFSPTSFAFSVVPSLSRARCFLCFPKSFFSFLTSMLSVSSLGFPLYFVNSL